MSTDVIEVTDVTDVTDEVTRRQPGCRGSRPGWDSGWVTADAAPRIADRMAHPCRTRGGARTSRSAASGACSTSSSSSDPAATARSRCPPCSSSTASRSASLRGTIFVLHDAGFTDDEAIDWLLTPEDSIGIPPIEALRAGRKSEVRRVAQALGLSADRAQVTCAPSPRARGRAARRRRALPSRAPDSARSRLARVVRDERLDALERAGVDDRALQRRDLLGVEVGIADELVDDPPRRAARALARVGDQHRALAFAQVVARGLAGLALVAEDARARRRAAGTPCRADARTPPAPLPARRRPRRAPRRSRAAAGRCSART